MATLTLEPVSARICRVLDGQGRHVGNLKLITGRWKFKAIGYDDSGACVPGGGPLTERHNTVFERLDPLEVSRRLGEVAAGEPLAQAPGCRAHQP